MNNKSEMESEFDLHVTKSPNGYIFGGSFEMEKDIFHFVSKDFPNRRAALKAMCEFAGILNKCADFGLHTKLFPKIEPDGD